MSIYNSNSIEYFLNSTNAIHKFDSVKVLAEPGSLIQNSYVSDGTYLERYCGLNRSSTLGPCGIGAFSFVSDSDIHPFTHIGARSSVGGFEHPTDRTSSSSYFWFQNTQFWFNNSIPSRSSDFEKPEPMRTILGADTWVGANAIIKSGVSVAIGSVIGAGSVLTKDTEAYGIYIGSPARLIRKRFTDTLIDQLSSSNWWELPPEILFGLDYTNPSVFLEQLNTYVKPD